jgi:hypothetical protein
MIHEMCHAIVWIHDGVFNTGHGPLWKKWTALAERTFPQLAPITTKHTYSTLRKAECEICKARHRPKNVHRAEVKLCEWYRTCCARRKENLVKSK